MLKKKSKIDVKNELAEKYERLARLTKSDPKRQQYHHRAVKFRRQAVQIGREAALKTS